MEYSIGAREIMPSSNQTMKLTATTLRFDDAVSVATFLFRRLAAVPVAVAYLFLVRRMSARFTLLLICTYSFAALAAEPREVSVTCKLPGDQQIWPLPKPTASSSIEGEFVSVEMLLRVRAGNFFQTTERAVYRVTASHGDYSGTEISFIFHDDWPTPESHIRVKKLDSPFAPGTKARFWLNKRGDEALWDIQTYEIWNDHFHRKPNA